MSSLKARWSSGEEGRDVRVIVIFVFLLSFVVLLFVVITAVLRSILLAVLVIVTDPCQVNKNNQPSAAREAEVFEDFSLASTFPRDAVP